ncbi:MULTISPECIES: hypothetical protein [Burkholderia]|nr:MULTISPECIES: hypothetical protein [Burkholderia]MBJ9676345.1 hypothetical protein [Burkholderia gladioli]MBU9172574.1 hypothetical protein [Burkholderia gladioli]MBU9180369.1 hypothetical protein [Burkholderia gladioli]MBU9278490.1 hypothetical protein [Burkholderia gladioli]MBU9326053.1 hypothetical protein [Burkholderia gladioli]
MSDDWTTSLAREEATQQLRANERAADDGMPAARLAWWSDSVATPRIRLPGQRICASRKRPGMHVPPKP